MNPDEPKVHIQVGEARSWIWRTQEAYSGWYPKWGGFAIRLRMLVAGGPTPSALTSIIGVRVAASGAPQ
jgi:hypothetical protein